MTSAVSFKEKFKQGFSIFKWDLRNCAGTLSVYSIIVFTLMLVAFILCITIGTRDWNSTDLNGEIISAAASAAKVNLTVPLQVFQLISAVIIYGLTVVFTIFYTVKVFSYLHDKRKADMYGSLPLSRVTLYISKSAAAFLFSLVPAMFFIGLMSVVSLCFGEPVVIEVTDIYINLVIGTLASIAAYALLAVCCGTTANAVIMFVAVCVAYPLSAMFVKGVIGGFFPGFDNSLLSKSFIINALNPLAAYDGRNIIYWIIFTVVCFLAGAFLTKKRKAERAQSSFAYYLPCHIVKVLLAFLMGMFLGMILGSLNFSGYGYTGFVLGFIIGSVPTFVIAHLIFYKGFSKLLKTSIPLGGLIVVVVLGMAVCNFDIFGYTNYNPKKDEIKSAGFIDTSYYYGEETDIHKIAKNAAKDFSDGETLNAIINCHSYIIDRLPKSSDEKFQNVWESMILGSELASYISDGGYVFSYQLSDGSVVTRTYPDFYGILYNESGLSCESIVETKEYVQKYSAMANAGDKELCSLGICGLDGYNNEQNVILSDKKSRENINKVVEAYRKDLEADKSGEISALLRYYEPELYEYYYDDYWYDSNDYNNENQISYLKEKYGIVCQLSLSVQQKQYEEKEIFGISEYFNSEMSEIFLVPESYVNTISALQEIGILNSDNTINTSNDFLDKYYGYY